MQVTLTDLPEVKILTPRRFSDSRGYFSETWNQRTLSAQGIDITFVQDNESLSRDVRTVRGLHYQAPPCAQSKLVRVLTGAILDVAVDARRGSDTYGRWVSVELSAENGQQILVPRGFLHGFVTLLPDTKVAYKVDNFYSGEHDGAVSWNDPNLAIDWKIDAAKALLSEKDAAAPAFSGWYSPFDMDNSA